MTFKEDASRIATDIKSKIIAEFHHAPIGTFAAVLVLLDLFLTYVVGKSEKTPSSEVHRITIYDLNMFSQYTVMISAYIWQIGISLVWVRCYYLARKYSTRTMIIFLFCMSITMAFLTLSNCTYYALNTTEPNESVLIGIYELPFYLIFVILTSYLVFENDGFHDMKFPWYKNAAYLFISWLIFHSTIASVDRRVQQYFNDRYTHAVTSH
jgi:hypothetical protein